MTRWKITVEYDGLGFSGWQRQPDAVTVQGTIEEAIKNFSDEIVTLHCAGRTDAGVHSLAQVAHFDLNKPTNGDVIRDALNFYLRLTKAVILHAEQVDENFHARFDASERRYFYRVINRRPPTPLQADRAWHVIKPLDINAMQKCADILVGTYDFSTFRAGNCQAKSPIRTLDKFIITRNGEEVIFSITARSFLYHQVRNMVGTLSLIGTGNWDFDMFQSAFKAADRTKGGPTAPAYGLYFQSVTYPQK